MESFVYWQVRRNGIGGPLMASFRCEEDALAMVARQPNSLKVKRIEISFFNDLAEFDSLYTMGFGPCKKFKD